VGEIGIPREQFPLLKWWEIRCIIRGYHRRHRHAWSSTRWLAFNLMSAQVGSDNMRSHGISSPTDLIKFPWECTETDLPSEDDIAEMQAMMASMNASDK
jgi:hypothetical protein